jgi:hypothetical protein
VACPSFLADLTGVLPAPVGACEGEDIVAGGEPSHVERAVAVVYGALEDDLTAKVGDPDVELL